MAYVPAAEEMYEYNPQTNVWVKKSYPSALGYFGSGVAFSIGNKGYMGIGWIHQMGKNTPMLFEYDATTDQWTRKADFPGTLRSNAVFFSLPNGKAYVGLGTTLDYQYLKDLWEYNPVTDSWRRLEDFPGTGRYSAVAFTVGDKAYIGAGYDGTFKSDFWEFSPAD
jgi:N-acetylneuraminic acid mutarotase